MVVSEEVKHNHRIFLAVVCGTACIVVVVIGAILIHVQCRTDVSPKTAIWPQPSLSPLGKYTRAAVSSGHGFCSEIGRDVLLHGGNAVDAAVAAILCAGVMDPHSSGLGGGLIMNIYTRETGRCSVVDAREVAPLAATQMMFKNASSTIGWKSIAVPGELHGLWHVFQKFGSGRIAWRNLVQPSADLASKGYPVSPFLARSLRNFRDVILNEVSMQNFINPQTKDVYKEGEIMRNLALGQTLQKLANSTDPVSLFYNGSIADVIVDEFKQSGAIITKGDFVGYRSLERKEIIETKLGDKFTVCGPPPPSSSAIVQAILNIMSGYSFGPTSTESNTSVYHRLIEAMKFAYAERSKLGDMSFVGDSLKIARRVASNEHAAWVRDRIDKASHPMSYYGGEFGAHDDHGTAHLNVIDSNGDAVAVTSTINTQ